MVPPTWAYQVDYFDPAPDEELVCSICQAVFCDPVQSPCNHVFCRNCIVKWLETNRNCPICRKRTTRSTLQEVVPLVKNMIMKLILQCHNREAGCKERFSLENCESHVKECDYEMVQCRNKPCKMMFMKRDVQEHEKNLCPYSYTRCSTCSLKISSLKPYAHNCVQALIKKVKEKNIRLKKCNQKIKSLQSELKAAKESNYSSTSSIGDRFSPSDILLGLVDSDVSSISSLISSSIETDSDESNNLWVLDSLTNEANGNNRRDDDSLDPWDTYEGSFHQSIEFPRSLNEDANGSELDVIDLSTSGPVINESEESPVRRPPKRRLTSRLLDSSDEEDLEDSPLPSRKRVIPLPYSSPCASPSSEINLEAAGPSYRPPLDSSTSTNDSSPRSTTRRTRKRRSRSRRTTAPVDTVESTATPLTGRNPIFERTLNLLQRYNIESDPEWLPGDEHGGSEMEGSNINDILAEYSESSISDIDSESSYEDAAEGRTEDLLNSFYGTSDSDSEFHA